MQLDTILNCDCLEGMKNIPDGSIDLIVTDPPYRVTSRGGVANTMSGYWVSEKARKGKIFDDNDIEIEEYLPHFYRVLKPDAHCYIMCNNLNLPHFFDVISKSDFHFVKLLVWDKVQAICGRYYMGQVEHIFLLRKGKDKPINDCGKSDLLSIPLQRDKDKQGNNIHDSQKPIKLFQVLVAMSSNEGQTVLDPFIGSGTTAVACMKEKRHFIGFELNEDYYKIACQRVKNEQQQLSLF
jgi:site-specific DNA-methyltransferase (adenine-specific)